MSKKMPISQIPISHRFARASLPLSNVNISYRVPDFQECQMNAKIQPISKLVILCGAPYTTKGI